jgi:uncharacterized protein (TIGR00369 family)
MSDAPSPDLVSPWALAFMQGLPFARMAGMTPTLARDSRGVLSMPARPEWTGNTATGQVHPGCLTVLADTACGVAVGAALDPMQPYATLDLRMDYLRPAMAGHELRCDAHCHRLTRSVAFVRGEVFQSGLDDPVATVNATFMLGTASSRRTDLAPEGHPAAALGAGAPANMAWSPVLDIGRSPYLDFLGVQRQDVPAGQSGLFRLPFKPELIGNPLLPALHGGVVAGFAESAAILHLAFSNPMLAISPKGIDFAIDYLRSAKPVDTWAQCTTVRQGSRVALVQALLWQDDPSRPIAATRSHCLLPPSTAI